MRRKHKARIIAERVMNVCYAIGIPMFFLSASGYENATAGNYVAIAISFLLIGVGLFIDNF